MRQIAPSAYEVRGGNGTDFVCFGNAKAGGVEFAGEALALRTSGGVRSLAWVNGTSLSYGGREVASASKPIKNLELIYDGETLTITADGAEPSLKVAALGAKSFRVNNGPLRPVTGAVIEPLH
jgi:hypothetical protein